MALNVLQLPVAGPVTSSDVLYLAQGGTTDTQLTVGKLFTSPNLTGTPTAPTAGIGTSTSQIATTAFVAAAIGATSSAVTSVAGRTGAVVLDVSDISNAVATGRTLVTSGSLSGGGDLSANRTLALVNDNATPGNQYYYGTNGSGTKGFFPIPVTSNTVTSVFGRTGNVVATSGDYTPAQVGLGNVQNVNQTNASNITSGTLSSGRLPAFTGGDVTSSTGTAVLTLNTVNSNVGTFGDATDIPVITVDATGRITAVTTAAVSTPVSSVFGQTGAIPNLSGDVTTSNSSAVTLKTVNATVGGFGDGNNVAVVTVNAKGLTTSVSTTPILPPGTAGQVSWNNAGARAGATNLTVSTDGLRVLVGQPTDDTASILQVQGVLAVGYGATTGSGINVASGATISNYGVTNLLGNTVISSLATYMGYEVGYLDVPQNSKSINYTTVMSDRGKEIFHPAADTTARTFTIDSNANVPYPVGSRIRFTAEDGSGTITIAINADTLVFVPSGASGSRTLTAPGVAEARKITSTKWFITGYNLT